MAVGIIVLIIFLAATMLILLVVGGMVANALTVLATAIESLADVERETRRMDLRARRER